jgi:F0F1-type ATP synthase assembly protein I
MAAIPLLYGLLGLWLDSLLGTSPVFLVTLVALGFASSFASAYFRYQGSTVRHHADKPWARKDD